MMKLIPWRRSARLLPGLASVVLLLALPLAAGVALTRATTGRALASRQAAVDPHVAAGALDYVTFACVNCHGLYGRGGVRVSNISGHATIPALNTAALRKSLNNTVMRFIIQHGVVYLTGGVRVYMPVWGAVLSDHQVSDLVSYVRAGMPPIAGIAPQAVRTDLGLVVEGQQLYFRFGCVVCHAFNGFGGVPNPASPDKTVPPLRGANFDQQFVKDSDIAYVIKHGSILGGPPIVSMPVWSGLLSDQQIGALVAYIRTFK
jgi:mono/diheme cytochrome c family protein